MADSFMDNSLILEQVRLVRAWAWKLVQAQDDLLLAQTYESFSLDQVEKCQTFATLARQEYDAAYGTLRQLVDEFPIVFRWLVTDYFVPKVDEDPRPFVFGADPTKDGAFAPFGE